MSQEPSIYFDEVNERQGTFHRRAILVGGFAGLGLAALGARLTQLQVLEAQRYQLLSASNQFHFRLQPPPRGRILDRNGVEIASNRPEFRLLLQREVVKDVDGAIDRVSAILPITDDKRRQILRDVAQSPRSAPVAIASDLSWDEFSRVNVRAPELPGLTAEMGESRVYPFAGAFVHVIGYVAKINAKELAAVGDNPEPLLLHPGFRIGKSGIEKALDLDLRGRPGGHKVEVDNVGRVIRQDPAGDVKTTAGKEVVLTLDADIQNRALEVFGDQSGAAVMMDVRNGDILCLMSAPAFDANEFAKGVTGPKYHELASYDHKPLLNKALSGTYPPGSTFKTMVALAALEHGIDRKTTHTCNGAWQFGNHVFHCDKHHGTQDMHGAIVTSCDVFFYQTAVNTGPDRIAQMARRFGLGDVFDIAITGQKPGLVPDPEWKRKHFAKTPANQKWFPGETPSMGIGQGYTNINPLQSCVMVSRLANSKKALVPRLVRSVGGVLQPSGAAVPDLPVDPEHLAFVRGAMADVVTSGTAAGSGKLDLGPLMMAGKTGTAQAHTYGGGHGAHGARGDWALRDHAWFVAFAPADDPRYALSVIVEHGGFGAEAAAPRAREIMKVALLKDPELQSRIVAPATPPPVPQPTVPT